MEERIRAWFRAWLDKDASALRDLFAAEALYVESYGPVYRGIGQILRWFEDWNRRGTVLQWDIRSFAAVGRTAYVEWFFRCEYNGEVGVFDGVTIARFDDQLKICELREFQSKAEHVFPYGEAPKSGVRPEIG